MDATDPALLVQTVEHVVPKLAVEPLGAVVSRRLR
jgi:hypothetical protein